MLLSREYKPVGNELIYHYCDASTFHSICTHKTIRLSDLFSMNDFLEIHWGYSIWEKAATIALSEVGKEFLDKIDEIIHFSGVKGLLLASCFSQNGDVLSQWRAYADDGKGYSIGFSANNLIQLPVRPLKVLYDEKQQISETLTLIRAIYQVEKEMGYTFENKFVQACLGLSFDLAAFKNPAFFEEQEVRLVHLLNFEESNNFLKLVDGDGFSFNQEYKGQQVKFRMSQNIPIPFIDIDFSNNGNVNPVHSIIIGPKNDVRTTTISVFLETIGIGNVIVQKSKASYR